MATKGAGMGEVTQTSPLALVMIPTSVGHNRKWKAALA